jgi:hypothetical protein
MTRSEREMRARLVARALATPADADELWPVGQTVAVVANNEAHAVNAARKVLSVERADAYMQPVLHVEAMRDRWYEVVIQTGWMEPVAS